MVSDYYYRKWGLNVKKKLDFKLINLLCYFNVFLAYKPVFMVGIVLSFKIIMPFCLAFIVAYALHPFLKYLQKRLPKGLVFFIVIYYWFFFTLFFVPLLFEQLTSLFNNIITFVKRFKI